MKKEKLVVIGALLVMLSPTRGLSQSEVDYRKDLWGGPTLGGGLFKFTGGGIDGPTSAGAFKSGFTTGAHISADLHQRIALRAEFLFVRKGSHHLVGGERAYSYELNYLELPLLARLSLPSIKDTFLPFVVAGPTVSFLLGATAEDVRQGEPRDQDGVYTSTDFGVLFGAGAAVRISPYDSLGLEIRYDIGLRAIMHNRDTINNRGLLLVLQYQTCICSRSAAR
jgi:hypothetical protein